MLRRLAVTATASLAALSAAPSAAQASDHSPVAQAADHSPLPLFHLLGLEQVKEKAGLPEGRSAGRLSMTVADSGGSGEGDGTYELKCGRDGKRGGTHPAADEACERLDELAAEGKDPFAPVPKDALCTMQHGGPATARVTGNWQGRPVDAEFSRDNGCEIKRWDDLVPALPAAQA